jgi:hypothetical protein
MPVSSRPSDKFAFLLTGPTDLRYLTDLKNVFTLLTEFYNYPAANIWVVQGSAAFQNAGDFINANQFAIGSSADPFQKLKDIFHSDPAGNLIKKISDHTSADPPPSGEFCTVLLYFTGCNNVASASQSLVIRPGTGTSEITISPADFTELIQYPRVGPAGIPLLKDCHLNVIMQQDYSGNYYSSVATDSSFITNRSFTNACGSTEKSAAESGSGSSVFTNVWTEGLQLKQLDNLASSDINFNKYADQLSPAPLPYHISLEQAKIFADKRSGATNYGYDQRLGGSESGLFLGKVDFLIQDGNNSTVGWWESPDITLTHPNYSANPLKRDDLYITDLTTSLVGPFNNTINVDFRNIGTHPVKFYNIGIQIYRTPVGPSAQTLQVVGLDTGTVLKPTNVISYNSFSNNNKQTYSWNTPFYTGITHQCIRAKVQLPDISINFSWSVTANNAEAQRNTDLSSDPPGTGSRFEPGDEFRGNKKHLYKIQNPFREPHTFIIATLPEYQKAMESVKMIWYFADKDGKWERKKFEIIEKGFGGFFFVLNGGETKTILGEFGFMKEYKEKKVRLPVEILIDRITGIKTRTPLAESLSGKFAALAGFTIIMTYEPANMFIKVTDMKGNPVPDAIINIQTVNGLNKEQLPVDKNGELILKAINPDVFLIKAIAKSGESGDQIVQLSGGTTEKVLLEIISPKHKRLSKK